MPFTFSCEDIDSVSLPVPHLNGTGKETLKAEYQAALDAVIKAVEAFHKTTFHQRDFYIFDDAANSKYYASQKVRYKISLMYRIIADYLSAHVSNVSDDKESAHWCLEALKQALDDK